MQILDGRDKLYQWDIGDFITDSDWQVGDEIHFDNGMSLIAPIVKAISKDGAVVAEVPNDMLQKDRDIRVYRYIVDGDSERTVGEQIFEVEKRPKPADYVYTPTEIWSYEALEKRVKTLEDDGVDITIDQDYNPESENAQSGKAVASAIKGAIGEISVALDGLHDYAQSLVNGGASE